MDRPHRERRSRGPIFRFLYGGQVIEKQLRPVCAERNRDSDGCVGTESRHFSNSPTAID